jgi:hypothetical protein
MAGVELDEINDAAGDSEDGGSGKPPYRVTGVELEVRMDFSNVGNFDAQNHDLNIDVVMTVKKKPKTWQSVGPRTYYIRYPTGDSGQQYEHKVITYPQDVTIDFVPTGQAYRFDLYTFVTAIIDAIVLLVSDAEMYSVLRSALATCAQLT